MKFSTLLALAALVTGLSLFVSLSHAADSEASIGSGIDHKNAISLELLGRGGLYSFDYDRMLSDKVAIGVGLSHYSFSSGSNNASATIVPLYANYYFGEGNGRFFATGGADVIFASAATSDSMVSGSGLAAVAGAGYEYRADNGFLFRAAPYLLIGKASGAWLGLTFGYAM